MARVTDDSTLWISFKEGRMESFRTLYFSHFSALYEYGMRLVKNEDLVKDAIQDLFIKLWNNKRNLADVKTVRPYLFVSLRSTIFNQIQKNTRVEFTNLEDHKPFEMVFSIETDMIKRETDLAQSKQLSLALNSLTPRQKEVIYLRFYEELDYEQIAEIMSITVKATYKLNARGLESLRQIMNLALPSLLSLLHMNARDLF